MANFESLKTTTLRDFSGGLDVVHDDLNMNKSFSKIERNIFLNIDGTKAKRYGTHYEFDLKKFNDITETYDTVTGETVTNIELLQDTLHTMTSNKYIKIITPEELAGTYKVKNLYEASTTIEIDLGKTISQSSYNEVVYDFSDTQTFNNYCNTTSKGVRIGVSGSTILQLTYKKNPLILTNYKINITEPSTLAGEYKVVSANDEKFTINIPNTSFTDQFFVYTYTRTDGEVFSKRSTYQNKTTTNYLNFKYKNHTQLFAGNKITILEPAFYANEYTIIKNDEESYSVKINTSVTSLSNVKIKHNNQNIQGNRIINCTYFVDKIIAVSDIGEVVMIGGTGYADRPWQSTIIFNDNIAKQINLESTLQGWHKTESVSFAVFNGILTIWNGVDKPLAVDFTQNYPCNYLLDPATGSNANVPIAKYALAFNHYLVCGNIYDELEQKQYTDRISISARDSIGVFYSGDKDDTDNDAVYIDLGNTISANKQIIKGLSRYRDKIVVGFDEVTVFGSLGNYTETTQTVDGEDVTTKLHNPNFEDVIDNYGCISHKTYQSLGSDLVCLDYSGIPAFSRRNIYSTIMPIRLSELIAPDLYQSFIGLTENIIENKIFSVLNPKNNQYMLFIPNIDEENNITDYKCYVYTMHNGNSGNGSWSLFTGWNFQCGLTTALNEVLFCNSTKFYSLGNIERPYYADFVDDPDYPPQDEEDVSGKEIEFEWEFPWADFGNRASVKNTRYLSLSTTGTAKFNVDLYVDYFYYKITEDDIIQEKAPHLSLSFVGGDSNGYGNGQQLYGGGRRTNTEFLFAYPCRFKICKFNINGSSKYKLNINSITIYYQEGNIRI